MAWTAAWINGEVITYTKLNTMRDDDANWKGNVNGGGFTLSNVVLNTALTISGATVNVTTGLIYNGAVPIGAVASGDVAAWGWYAGQNNTKTMVSVVGSYAGRNNTGEELTAIGYAAAENNTGNYLTALGKGAMPLNTGNECTAVGCGAAESKLAGAHSTFVGSQDTITGTQKAIEKSTILGALQAGTSVNNSGGTMLTNCIAINGAITGSNQTVIGNANTLTAVIFGSLGIGVTPTSPLQAPGLPTYASNALAESGGLTHGAFYIVAGDPAHVAVVT
jgi:hypothetical protein